MASVLEQVHHDFDSLTVNDLRGVVGYKWTAFPDCIGAFVAEMDFGTAPVIQEALRTVVDSGFMGYLPPAAREGMQTATAAWYRDHYGWNVPAEQVHALPDVIKGLEVAIQHFSPPGSKVIVPTPAYMPFLSVPQAMGRELIQVPSLQDQGRWRVDEDALDRAFRDGGGLLVLCNPNNPLGRVMERDELERIAAVVDAHGGRVFSDEIHAPLIYPGYHHVPYASLSDTTASHTVTAASASKAWNLAGLKCAQLILSNDLDQRLWQEVGMFAGHGASTLGVIANTVAYTEGEPWLNEVLAYLDQNRQFLAELLSTHLPEVSYTPPEGTYLAWLDFRSLGFGCGLDVFLRENAGVAVVCGAQCGDVGEGFARFNFATSRRILQQAVEQIAAAVHSRS